MMGRCDSDPDFSLCGSREQLPYYPARAIESHSSTVSLHNVRSGSITLLTTVLTAHHWLCSSLMCSVRQTAVRHTD